MDERECCNGRGTWSRPVRFRPPASGRYRHRYRSVDRRWLRAATLRSRVESTPPERPQMTWPLPTCSRILAMDSSRNASIVQSPVQPQILCVKFFRSCAPCGVCTTSGWNCVAQKRRSSLEMIAYGAPSDLATTLKPGASLRDAVAVAHPHLFVRALGPDIVGDRALADHVDISAAKFAGVAALDLAAELVHHHLLAVTDAEDRQAQVIDIRSAGAGRSRRIRAAAGEPEKIMPLGLKALSLASSAWLYGQISQ